MGVCITPASVTFRLPIWAFILNKQMLLVVYVQKCHDRNVSRSKSHVPLSNIDKLFNPNLEPCQVLYHSGSEWI